MRMNIGVRILAALVMAFALLIFGILMPFICAADALGLKRYANKIGIDWEMRAKSPEEERIHKIENKVFGFASLCVMAFFVAVMMGLIE